MHAARQPSGSATATAPAVDADTCSAGAAAAPGGEAGDGGEADSSPGGSAHQLVGELAKISELWHRKGGADDVLTRLLPVLSQVTDAMAGGTGGSTGPSTTAGRPAVVMVRRARVVGA